MFKDRASEPALADEFSAFAQAAAGDKLKTDAALRARFSRLYTKLSEIDEKKSLGRSKGSSSR